MRRYLAAKERALEAMGLQAERYAKQNLTEARAVDTGHLRNRISHMVDGDDVYVGTNVEYAPFVEFGTGIYAADGTGRKTPWAYYDAKGKKHFTRGMKPRPYLKPAAADHNDTYKDIFGMYMSEL